MASVAEIILKEIVKKPGITSPEICVMFPSINKDTLTSCVSKLKKRGLINSDAVVQNGIPVKLYPSLRDMGPMEQVQRMDAQTPTARVAPSQRPTPVIKEVEPDIVSNDEVKRILEPFADYAKKMKKNDIVGTLNVWLSATTDKPTVMIAPGSWFLDALNLYEKIR